MQTPFHQLSFWFYLAAIRLFSIMPFGVLYPLSSFGAVLLQYVFRYRRRVLRENLRNSFPSLNQKALRTIERRSYLNLTDILLETMKMPTMTKQALMQRFTIEADDRLNRFIKEKQSIIVLSAHFGNWEWGALAAPELAAPMKPVGFYKPLSNKNIDHFEKRVRGKFGLEMVSMFQTTKTFNLHRQQPSVFFMIADQSPADRKTAIWNDFLGRPTAWLHGPEKHSKRHNYPVFLFLPVRTKRGHYIAESLMLSDNPASLPSGELIKKYSALLEQYIRLHPEQWLWTHRRWKMKPPDQRMSR